MLKLFQVSGGSLVLDPFVGTASLLIAAAEFGKMSPHVLREFTSRNFQVDWYWGQTLTTWPCMPEVDPVELDRRFHLFKTLEGCWCSSCRFVLLMKTWLPTFINMVLPQGLSNHKNISKKTNFPHKLILGILGLSLETPGSFDFSMSFWHYLWFTSPVDHLGEMEPGWIVLSRILHTGFEKPLTRW